MSKLNCWEVKKCGREPGGEKSHDLGVCPASTDQTCNGLNEGNNAGRICWAIAGTFCGGKVQGDFAQKSVSCMSCEFFKQVKGEEPSDSFTLLKPGQAYQAAAK
ncbi:MAG: hypothetical protein AMK70_05305 [Nitrospira bacterium SG8_35_1]|nr:MAG: hypothetical protein AMK70_05305 [Nitrospira bacterium SG8_35_1]UCE71924.1 MAG: hypothetical protein JSU99_01055 [Nitrospiraceae bacterium]UCH45465.1 MAG: hypothetical protein JSV11_01810 [Nitrospiraceae bacterium]